MDKRKFAGALTLGATAVGLGNSAMTSAGLFDFLKSRGTLEKEKKQDVINLAKNMVDDLITKDKKNLSNGKIAKELCKVLFCIGSIKDYKDYDENNIDFVKHSLENLFKVAQDNVFFNGEIITWLEQNDGLKCTHEYKGVAYEVDSVTISLKGEEQKNDQPQYKREDFKKGGKYSKNPLEVMAKETNSNTVKKKGQNALIRDTMLNVGLQIPAKDFTGGGTTVSLKVSEKDVGKLYQKIRGILYSKIKEFMKSTDKNMCDAYIEASIEKLEIEKLLETPFSEETTGGGLTYEGIEGYLNSYRKREECKNLALNMIDVLLWEGNAVVTKVYQSLGDDWRKKILEDVADIAEKEEMIGKIYGLFKKEETKEDVIGSCDSIGITCGKRTVIIKYRDEYDKSSSLRDYCNAAFEKLIEGIKSKKLMEEGDASAYIYIYKKMVERCFEKFNVNVDYDKLKSKLLEMEVGDTDGEEVVFKDFKDSSYFKKLKGTSSEITYKRSKREEYAGIGLGCVFAGAMGAAVYGSGISLAAVIAFIVPAAFAVCVAISVYTVYDAWRLWQL